MMEKKKILLWLNHSYLIDLLYMCSLLIHPRTLRAQTTGGGLPAVEVAATG